jgi:hypothetical protein
VGELDIVMCEFTLLGEVFKEEVCPPSQEVAHSWRGTYLLRGGDLPLLFLSHVVPRWSPLEWWHSSLHTCIFFLSKWCALPP